MSNIHIEDTPLYKLWQLASSKGYSLHLYGDTIDLVPLTKQGSTRTIAWHDNGFKEARAWLEKVTPQSRDTDDRER